MEMTSPFLTNARLPPVWASGEICPTTKPWVPPENLPSVIRATSEPRPAPMIAAVGFNISGMPGPPLGPTYLMTKTSPLITFSFLIAEFASSSESKTFAGPEKFNPSFPVIFATQPSSAKFPYIIVICPFCFMGFFKLYITS